VIKYQIAYESNVKKRFVKNVNVLKALNIRNRRNILNFDETEFRIDCSKEEQILMSSNIKKVLAVSFDNRKSVIIFELINAVDDYLSSSMINIQKQEIMIN
jgi:hypothetical protein